MFYGWHGCMFQLKKKKKKKRGSSCNERNAKVQVPLLGGAERARDTTKRVLRKGKQKHLTISRGRRGRGRKDN